MLSFLNKYSLNIFSSQNGEEGILLECIKRMGITTGHAVEVGANDGLFCSNTALLIREHGWTGRMIETDFNLWRVCIENWVGYPVKCTCSHVDGDNINAFVDGSCDVLSLDTDGSDYKVFKGLRAKPKIVIVEIDSSIPPERLEFNAEGGAGYGPMVLLGLDKGYFVLCHTGNLIFVRDDFRKLFPEVIGEPSDFDLYFNRAWLQEAA
jgi:hypothetical protein